jgi:GTP-dependent phosphoenolpyruvate carboxykinase
MNADSMKKDATSAEYSSVEQHLNVDNQQEENSMDNHTNSEEIVSIVNKVEKTPMTPSTLYISFFSF